MSDSEAFKFLIDAIDANGFTFSKSCRSAYEGGAWLDKCQCWRCRESRGEERTPESDARAATDAMMIDELQRRQCEEFLRGSK